MFWSIKKSGELILMHYANTPMQYIANFNSCKNGIFQMKNCDIFAQNIDRGYILELPLTSTHNLCFRAKIRKKLYTPANPSFYYIKVWCKGDVNYMGVLF